MGLNLNDKKAVVAEVSAQVANAQTIVIAEYRGIEVTDLTVLRRKARESGVYLRVLKNTLVRRAVAGTEFAGLADQMVGPLIYSVSADPVAAAKGLNDFAKTNRQYSPHFQCLMSAATARETRNRTLYGRKFCEAHAIPFSASDRRRNSSRIATVTAFRS